MYYATEAIAAATAGDLSVEWLWLVAFGVVILLLAMSSLRENELFPPSRSAGIPAGMRQIRPMTPH